MILDFLHDGDPGQIEVSCVPNDDPERIGKAAETRGFPICTASVEHPAEGYRSFCGWVQLVRSDDNRYGGSAFEMDPLRYFEDSPAPYCFFGSKPVLFDAPSRDEREPLAWVAHSFLGFTPRQEEGRCVVPLAGFSWGFDIGADRVVRLRPVERLRTADWKHHLPYLRDYYRTWSFESRSIERP